MIVIVTGSSRWTDRNVIWETLDELYENAIKKQELLHQSQLELFPYEKGITIYNGEHDSGVDLFTQEWFDSASYNGQQVSFVGFPAKWTECSELCPPPFVSGYEKHFRKGVNGRYCSTAGIYRNKVMVNKAFDDHYRYFFRGIVLAFCLNDSPGTIHCARAAKRLGFQPLVFRQGTINKRI